MKTFVINLKRNVSRREHMIKVLSNFSNILETTFIEAVDGKELLKSNQNNISILFDRNKSLLKYGRDLYPGEIGCTLSHRKCYKEIVNSKIDYALILEDDIKLECNNIDIIKKLMHYIKKNEPTIILLSNNVWYTRKKDLGNFKLLKVYDAYFSHSYIINYAAAKIILGCKPFYLADDWKFIRNLGIKIYSLFPYLTKQYDYEEIESNICNEHKGRPVKLRNMSVNFMFERIVRAIVRRILKNTNHKII